MNKGVENSTQRKSKLFTIAAIVAIVMMIFFLYTGSYEEYDSLYKLNHGWTVTVNGTKYEDVTLSDFKFDVLNKGDEVDMIGTLPDEEVRTPVLIVKSVLSIMDVYVDDELIYTYGRELADENKLLGYGMHLIEGEEGYAGKSLRIHYIVTENNAFNYIETPSYGDSISSYRNFTTDNRLALAVNLFLIVFGILIFIVAIFSAIRESEYMRIVWVALFSIAIGIWSLSNYNLLLIFTPNLLTKTNAEYWSLYMAILFVMAYFHLDAKQTKDRKIKLAYKVVMSLDGTFILLTGLLTGLNIVHLPDVLKISHVLMVLGFIVTLMIVREKFVASGGKNISILVGLMLFAATALFDVVHFNVQKFFGLVLTNQYTSFVCVGVLIFIVSMLLDFGFEITKRLQDAAKSEALEKMAYTDGLTGLYNRRKADEVMQELSGEINYGILNFDLNNLKKMNDNFGHEQGDHLIKTFAGILKKTFGDNGIVCRMGGDEFAVLFLNMNSVDLEKLLAKLEDEIKKANELYHLMVEVSAAHGFCMGTEPGVNNPEEAFRIADARMYENKLEIKKSRQ